MKFKSIYRYRRNKSLYFLVVLLLAGLASSCNKQLDELRPHNVIFEDMQFERPEGYSNAVVGVYNLISGGPVVNVANYNDMFIFLSEAKGNTIRALDAEVNKNTDAFNYINSSIKDRSHTYDFWRSSYSVLLHLNKILAHVKADETNSVILQAKAEALFLRAYVYFNLVRLYGKPYYQSPDESLGVMLILDDKIGPEFAPKRATVQQVYAQILNDLETAAPLFAQKKSNSYAGKFAAYALLSRVYLYMGGTVDNPVANFNQKAAEYADKVIKDGGYQLLQDQAYLDYYKSNNVNNKEDIFAVNTDYAQGQIGNYFVMPAQIGYSGGLYRPSPSFLSALEADDKRNGFYISNVTPGYPDDTRAVSKYMIRYQSLFSFSPLRYLRLAEMYLNRAEAYAKLNNAAAALSDVNVIRQRVGLTALSTLEGKLLLHEILKQRKLELAFEGHASYDEFRNGLPMVRNYKSGSSSEMNISPTDKKIIMQIPEEEIVANPNLVQN